MKDLNKTTRNNLPEGEKALDVYVRKKIKELGGLYIKLGTTYMSGLPDRMILRDGKTIFVELKGKGNKPTPKQLAVHKQFFNCGHRVHVLTGGEPKNRLLEILYYDEEF